MIEMPRPPFDFSEIRLKVFGLGGAGCNVLDRLVLDGADGVDLVAINTDAQSLAGSVVPAKVQIGQTITRGLGAGGDPEVGRTAAEEGIGEILSALADSTMVIIVAGLGGGTGSGGLPVVTEISREHNALVVVVVTMPFGFEGARRLEQARQTLAAVEEKADVLICFENDQMAEMVSAKAGGQEGFAIVDQTLSSCIRNIIGFTRRRGPMHIGFDELAAAFSRAHARALFAVGEARGDNRAHEAVELALKNPLLDRGRQLRELQVGAIQIAGGPDLTLHEINTVTGELHRYLPDSARLFFGFAFDPVLTGALNVTIFGSVSSEPLTVLAPAPEAAAPLPVEEEIVISAEDLALAEEEEMELLAAEAEAEEAAKQAAADAEAHAQALAQQEAAAKAAPAAQKLFTPLRNLRKSEDESAAAKAEPKREEKMEQLQFEQVNRGRFEKSEPTMSKDGEDLDVPTFMRHKIKLK